MPGVRARHAPSANACACLHGPTHEPSGHGCGGGNGSAVEWIGIAGEIAQAAIKLISDDDRVQHVRSAAAKFLADSKRNRNVVAAVSADDEMPVRLREHDVIEIEHAH